MAYGQFTGYEPLPGGQGYMLQTVGGTRFPAVGPEAEKIRQGIDRANSAPTSLAGAAAAPQPAAYQPGQGPLAPPPQQQAAAPTASRMFSGKDGSTIALKDGGDPNNPAHWIKTTPGRRGSPGGMAEVARQSQGGYTVDEQFLQQMEESKLRQAAIEEQSFQQGISTAAERQAFAKGQQQQLQREAAVQAHENQVKQQRLGDLQAKFDRAEQEFNSFHADKEAERESPKAKLATFLGGLAGALGALGATLGRTPNFAAEAVARHNEMQLRREEAELRVKKDAKDSLLGRLQQEMGSLDLAKNAYRAIQSRQSALGWEALAQKEQDQQRQATMLRASEIHNQEYLKWREAYTRGAEGEITRSFRFVPGQAASGPRQTGLSIEEASQLADLTAKQAGVAKTEAETGKTRAEIASGTAGTGPRISDTSANALANIGSVRTLLPDVAIASEQAGFIATTGTLTSGDTAKYVAKARTLARIAGKAVEGDAAAESNVKSLEADLTSLRPDKRMAAMQALDQILAEKERQMKAIVPGAPQ